jgi:uncharacterized protein (DUF433 family)
LGYNGLGGILMSDVAITETIPIYSDDDGRMRVSGTRVLFDLLVYAYHQGKTPEHIIQMYPTLSLESVYFALAYYLRHREEVDAYVQRMEVEEERFRREWEEKNPPRITRAELEGRLTYRM